MILRWTAAGVLEAERHFRKVAGYRALPRLAAVLHARDVSIDRARGVDNRKQAAYMTIEPSLKINSEVGISVFGAQVHRSIKWTAESSRDPMRHPLHLARVPAVYRAQFSLVCWSSTAARHSRLAGRIGGIGATSGSSVGEGVV